MENSSPIYGNQVFTASYEDTLTLLESIQDDIPSFEIQEDQIECLDAIQEIRIMGQKRALVQMATGRGKTTIVAADVKRFLADKPEARVLFLCHQNDILEQAQERFKNIIGDDYSYGKFTGEAKDYHEVSCLFASFQAMHNWKEAFLVDEFDYVVVDESHHSKAATYEPTLEYFEPQFMLGVTATPDRHDLKDIREIFGEEIYKQTLEEALAQGLLTPVEYHVITDDIIDTRTLKDRYGQRYNLAQLDRTIFAPKRNEEILRIIEQRSKEIDGVKRIIFCKSIEQANQYALHFADGGALHSKMTPEEQDQQIRKFRLGILNTLIAVDMFNEGIDIPEANQIIFLRETASESIFLQQLGRGLRRYPGKDKVQVLDFVANCERLLMLDDFWRLVDEHIKARQEADKNYLKIDTGNVTFSDATKDILELLEDMEQRKAIARNWTAEDSITYYKSLCERLGDLATNKDIISASRDTGAPRLYTVLQHYGMNINKLREAAGLDLLPPPADWQHLVSIAETTERSLPWVSSAIKSLRLEGRTFKGVNGRRTAFYSPEDIQKIKATDTTPHESKLRDHTLMADAAASWEVNKSTLARIAKQLGVTPVKLIDQNSGHEARFLNYQQIEVLSKHPRLAASRPPDELSSIADVRQMLNTSESVLDRVSKLLSIQPPMYVNSRGRMERYYNNEQIETISNLLESDKNARESYITVTDAAEKLSISRNMLTRICGEQNISTYTLESYGNRRFLLETDLAFIAEHPTLVLEVAPNNYVDSKTLETKTGLGEIVLNQILKDMGEQWQHYKVANQAKRARYLSKEVAKVVLAQAQSAATFPPDDFIPKSQVASENNLSLRQLDIICADLGIHDYLFRSTKRTTSIVHYLNKNDVTYLNLHPTFNIEQKTGDHKAQTDLIFDLKVTVGLLKHAVIVLDITPIRLKSRINRENNYYSPEQVSILEDYFGDIVEVVPKGSKTVGIIARDLNKAKGEIQSIVLALKLRPMRLYYENAKRTYNYFTPDQIQEIATYQDN